MNLWTIAVGARSFCGLKGRDSKAQGQGVSSSKEDLTPAALAYRAPRCSGL